MGIFDKKPPEPKRFIKKSTQSFQMGLSMFDMMIMIDSETGVNYIVSCMYEGGVNITPLLNPDGSIVVSPLPISEEE